MLLCLVALPLLGAEAPLPHPVAATHAGLASVDVSFTGLRSARGMVRACMTRNPSFFPRCQDDPEALKASVAAGPKARMAFTGVPAGDYALMVLHDENGNARVDKLMGIPREGVGFSRNPVLYFGPPSFEAVRFHVASEGGVQEGVVIRYFL